MSDVLLYLSFKHKITDKFYKGETCIVECDRDILQRGPIVEFFKTIAEYILHNNYIGHRIKQDKTSVLEYHEKTSLVIQFMYTTGIYIQHERSKSVEIFDTFDYIISNFSETITLLRKGINKVVYGDGFFKKQVTNNPLSFGILDKMHIVLFLTFGYTYNEHLLYILCKNLKINLQTYRDFVDECDGDVVTNHKEICKVNLGSARGIGRLYELLGYLDKSLGMSRRRMNTSIPTLSHKPSMLKRVASMGSRRILN